MQITALGHAGFKIDTADATVLMDPWLSAEGAFQASWFQYPDNHHLATDDLRRPTAIVISHEHCDHVDPWFLTGVPESVPIVIPRYPSPVLKRKLLAGGPRRIIEANSYEPVEIAGNTSVFFVTEASPMNHDAAMVLRGDDQVFLNLNDARLFPMQLRAVRHAVGGTVHAFALQGAGASWFPMCYRFPDERLRQLSLQKRQAKFAYTHAALKIVEPVTVLPSAGPPCFLAGDLACFNDEMKEGIFPDQRQVADWLESRGHGNVGVLLPGDVWDASSRAKTGDPRWDGFRFGDRGYIEDYAARRRDVIANVLDRYPAPTASLFDPFCEYFERLLSMNGYFNGRIGMRVGFEIDGPGGGEWAVDFRSGSQGIAAELGDCHYVYRFESRWLPPILSGEVPWEDFMLSLRFEARRSPDRYNDHLLGLLKFATPEALAAVEAFETSQSSDELMTIHSEGKRYRVNRYCPHAGNDLMETGEVLAGGILRCLAHHYDFDLKTGECLNGVCPSLEVEEIAEATPH